MEQVELLSLQQTKATLCAVRWRQFTEDACVREGRYAIKRKSERSSRIKRTRENEGISRLWGIDLYQRVKSWFWKAPSWETSVYGRIGQPLWSFVSPQWSQNVAPAPSSAFFSDKIWIYWKGKKWCSKLNWSKKSINRRYWSLHVSNYARVGLSLSLVTL